jgi:GntR family transcriptional regulator
MTIDKKSIIPMYFQLADFLREKIHTSQYSPGDLLPSEFELMTQFEISRGTVRQAIQQLELEGLLERFKGKGTFVSVPKIEQDASKQMGFFTKSMQEVGITPTAKVLSIKETAAPKIVQKMFGLTSGENIIVVKRLRLVNDEPWAIELEYFRHDVGNKLMAEDLTGSIYEILQEKYSYIIYHSKNTIEAIIADEDQANLLNVRPGSPLFEVKRLVYIKDGPPFEYAIDLLRGDRIKFSIDDYYQEEKAQFKIETGAELYAK